MARVGGKKMEIFLLAFSGPFGAEKKLTVVNNMVELGVNFWSVWLRYATKYFCAWSGYGMSNGVVSVSVVCKSGIDLWPQPWDRRENWKMWR